MDPFQNSFVAVAVQITGLLMVAAVLRPFTRLVPGRSLDCWWVAWLVQAVSLGLLYAAHWTQQTDRVGYYPLISGYCLTEYLFGFLLWAGCEEIAAGRLPRPRQWAFFAPFLLAAFALPALLPTFREMFPLHAVFAGGPFAATLVSLFRIRGADGRRLPGSLLMRLSVGGLVLLLWHYPLVAGLVGAGVFDPELFVPYMEFWKLYDLLLETGLAFGMVVFAADRVRAELADRNRLLADVTDELIRAARTDALTGLLNRRALDDLASDLAANKATGCVVALDVNDLKPLNDRYGHAAGDAAIQVIARALRNLFRVTDPIFRTGGDEFVIVVVNGTPADLCARLATLDAGVTGRLPGCDEPVTVTVAWGWAEFGPHISLWAAADRADAAMYLAKSKSKSYVVKSQTR